MLLREKKRWLILLLAAWGVASVAPACGRERRIGGFLCRHFRSSHPIATENDALRFGQHLIASSLRRVW